MWTINIFSQYTNILSPEIGYDNVTTRQFDAEVTEMGHQSAFNYFTSLLN